MAVQLITGGAGFIGSHLAEALLSLGQEVVVLDDLSNGKLANIPEDAKFISMDIANKKLLEKVFKTYQFENVYHLAALINTSVLTEQPLVDVRISVQGTINLAELCIAKGVKRLVYASSVGVYGRPKCLPVDEESVLEPIYSYSIAKFCAEKYLDFYSKTHGLAYHCLRYSNVYGPRQPIYGEVGVIAIFTERLKHGEKLAVFGDGEHIRDFIYVSDVVDATIRSAFVSENHVLNIASGKGTTVNELVKIYRKLSGDKFSVEHKAERVGELGKFFCKIDKARDTLEWEPEINVKQGIEKTLGYYGVI